MIKAEHPHPGESVDTTDKEILAVDCSKFKVYTIEEINKMIRDGPDAAFHKVKLERVARKV